MAFTYKLSNLNIVLRSDGASVPKDLANLDYQEYLKWVAAGNTPTPADPVVVIDQGDLDFINKQMRALGLLIRTYTNQTRAGITTTITTAQLKADFKTAFDSLP